MDAFHWMPSIGCLPMDTSWWIPCTAIARARLRWSSSLLSWEFWVRIKPKIWSQFSSWCLLFGFSSRWRIFGEDEFHLSSSRTALEHQDEHQNSTGTSIRTAPERTARIAKKFDSHFRIFQILLRMQHCGRRPNASEFALNLLHLGTSFCWKRFDAL